MKGGITGRLCEVANLALGIFLFASPWIFGFAAGTPFWNTGASGMAIVLLSFVALAAFAAWEEWLNLLVGAWVCVSPWLFGFAGTTAANVHLAVGAAVVLLGGLDLWSRRRPLEQLAGS